MAIFLEGYSGSGFWTSRSALSSTNIVRRTYYALVLGQLMRRLYPGDGDLLSGRCGTGLSMEAWLGVGLIGLSHGSFFLVRPGTQKELRSVSLKRLAVHLPPP